VFPVTGFNVGGIPHVIEDRQTGYVAQNFDATDLAAGIKWILSDPTRLKQLKSAARKRACEQWSSVVADGYAKIYANALNNR
jgi:glycosyltransferase involved in cell wall biosynthesis